MQMYLKEFHPYSFKDFMAWIKAHYRNDFHMARMIIARRRRKANMETKMIRLANLSFSITYT